jgi:hypothetical protein
VPHTICRPPLRRYSYLTIAASAKPPGKGHEPEVIAIPERDRDRDKAGDRSQRGSERGRERDKERDASGGGAEAVMGRPGGKEEGAA